MLFSCKSNNLFILSYLRSVYRQLTVYKCARRKEIALNCKCGRIKIYTWKMFARSWLVRINDMLG